MIRYELTPHPIRPWHPGDQRIVSYPAVARMMPIPVEYRRRNGPTDYWYGYFPHYWNTYGDRVPQVTNLYENFLEHSLPGLLGDLVNHLRRQEAHLPNPYQAFTLPDPVPEWHVFFVPLETRRGDFQVDDHFLQDWRRLPAWTPAT